MKTQPLKYKVEWYNRPITSMLIVSHIFGNDKGIYSEYKRIKKEGIKDVDLQEYLTQYLYPFVKGKLPANVEIVVAHTILGPVFRICIGDRVLPLREDGVEPSFVVHSDMETVIGGSDEVA